MNDFQKAMLENKSAAWEIVKIFHPDIKGEYPNNYTDKIIITKDRLKITHQYDWIIIELRVQSHIKVHLGIEFECHLMSGPKPMELFVKEHDNNKFRAWRFADDSKYVQLDPENYSNSVNYVLKHFEIPKPTPKQMFFYYHKN